MTNGEKWFNYFNKTYGVENVEWTSKALEGNGDLRERVFTNIEKSRLARESSIGNNRVLFYSSDDDDVFDIVDYYELYTYLTIACEFYIKNHKSEEETVNVGRSIEINGSLELDME